MRISKANEEAGQAYTLRQQDDWWASNVPRWVDWTRWKDWTLWEDGPREAAHPPLAEARNATVQQHASRLGADTGKGETSERDIYVEVLESGQLLIGPAEAGAEAGELA